MMRGFSDGLSKLEIKARILINKLIRHLNTSISLFLHFYDNAIGKQENRNVKSEHIQFGSK